MERIQLLDAIIAKYDLNTHPFYQDWRMGTLPQEDLVDYSGEYGRFVALIAKGWETIGEKFYADEEREHEVLWANFQNSIGFSSLSNRVETDALVSTADNLFGTEATAFGALYAFEAQQPNTTQSKLKGLQEHYNVGEAGEEYFKVHAEDFAEAEILRTRIMGLSEEDFALTLAACDDLCQKMWGALDGVYTNRQVINA